jgi:hypothetical protein
VHNTAHRHRCSAHCWLQTAHSRSHTHIVHAVQVMEALQHVCKKENLVLPSQLAAQVATYARRNLRRCASHPCTLQPCSSHHLCLGIFDGKIADSLMAGLCWGQRRVVHVSMCCTAVAMCCCTQGAACVGGGQGAAVPLCRQPAGVHCASCSEICEGRLSRAARLPTACTRTAVHVPRIHPQVCAADWELYVAEIAGDMLREQSPKMLYLVSAANTHGLQQTCATSVSCKPSAKHNTRGLPQMHTTECAHHVQPIM